MPEKDPHAVALGRRGGLARAARLTPAQRSEAGRKAVLARWAKASQQQPVNRMGQGRLPAGRRHQGE